MWSVLRRLPMVAIRTVSMATVQACLGSQLQCIFNTTHLPRPSRLRPDLSSYAYCIIRQVTRPSINLRVLGLLPLGCNHLQSADSNSRLEIAVGQQTGRGMYTRSKDQYG